MKIRLIVPNCNTDLGVPLDAVSEYGTILAEIAGGFTATQAVGGWKDDTGRLIVESVTVFDCYVDCVFKPHQSLYAIDFRKLARRIARDLHQDCVYLEIDGVVEFITK